MDFSAPVPPVLAPTKRSPFAVAVIGAVLALGVGGAIGYALPHAGASAPCLAALSDAEAVMTDQAQALNIASDAFGHIFNSGVMASDTAQMKALTPKAGADRAAYDAAAGKCRG